MQLSVGDGLQPGLLSRTIRVANQTQGCDVTLTSDSL